MSFSTPRRALVALTVLATAAGLAGSVGGPAVAAPLDPRPERIGAAWLADEPTDGILFNRAFGFEDVGLSIDAALALDEVDRQAAVVTEITDAVESRVRSYTGEGTERYAGALGKVLTLATEQARNGRDFGGVDVVRRLNATVLDAGPAAGRIHDISEFGDFANVIGQAFAARGLTAAGSVRADEVTAFLLEQQCAEGWFRLAFSDRGDAVQSCEADPDSQPDPDVTALAALALLEVDAEQANPAALSAARRAAAWLADQQGGNGSLGGGATTGQPNTNSTGLAGWLFGRTGDLAAAESAAGWVRGRQAATVAPCLDGLVRERGAIAYDDAALRTGRRDGITKASEDQWRRATSQALPALQWAPDATRPLDLTGPDGYVRAGRTIALRVRGLAAGAPVCVHRSRVAEAGTAGAGGRARVDVPLPRRTRTVRFTATDADGAAVTTRVQVLGPRRFDVSVAKERVARRGQQRVQAAGMAAGERYAVRYAGRTVARGTADEAGRVVERFSVGSRLGRRTVLVLGQFPSLRRGSDTFTVRR